MNDLKYALRQLGKSPGFTAIAVLVLGLGIGANATIFSIINSILIKPLQVLHPEQLVGLYQHDRENPDSFSQFSYLDFVDLRRAEDVAFTDLFAFRFSSVGMQSELTEKIPACFVSANYFAALSVAPARGRWFLPEEEASGARVAVLTHSFWTRLGADPDIVGQKIKLTRGDATVVGVMPPGFTGAQLLAPAIFFPVGMAPALNPNPGQETSRILTDRSDGSFMIMGRLKPGLTLANVDGALAPLNVQFAVPDPARPKPRTLICAAPSRFNFSSQPTQGSHGLAPIAGFASALALLVLLIACLNLANMMLARGAARRKEVAIRLALGAGQTRILKQLLTEGLLLALLGTTAGLVVSAWARNVLTTLIYSGSGMPPDFPKFDLSSDPKLLLVLLCLSGLATLVFALGPAWKLARIEINSDLKQQAGNPNRDFSRAHWRTREFLAIGQMATALVLMVAAALFTRSATNIAEATPGFEFGSNFYLALDPELAGFSRARVRQLTSAAIDRLSALPGVESVSAATTIPFGNSWNLQDVQMGGAPLPSAANSPAGAIKKVTAIYNVVGADYFRTVGIRLQRGREFDRHEAESDGMAAPVAIISQSLAAKLWPGQDPLGRSIQFSDAAVKVMTIVGVASEVSWQVFKNGARPQVYVPLGQDFPGRLNLHVRVAPGMNSLQLIRAARTELKRLDPEIPVTDVQTLRTLHRDGPTVRVARLGSLLFGAFGFLAMLLSLLGVYGLKAFAVARRTREIGIRMALGANRHQVVGMLLRESGWLAVLGLGVGFVLALAVARLAQSFLYNVAALDPITFSLVPLLLLCTVLLACLVPARRAARLEPMTALRDE